MRRFISLFSAAMTASFVAFSAQAADVTLRFHQFLPIPAAIPGGAIELGSLKSRQTQMGVSKLNITHQCSLAVPRRHFMVKRVMVS